MLGVTTAKRAADLEKTQPLTIEEQVDKERKEQEEFEAAFEEWRLENAGENDNDFAFIAMKSLKFGLVIMNIQ